MQRNVRDVVLLYGAHMPYYKKVLGYGPIAYWPMWEPAGAVAGCLVDPAQNGAYTGVTLGQLGIGDGKTCPYFDGANDYNNIYSVPFAGAFNGAEGTAIIWAQVLNAAVWTDASFRNVINILADFNNYIDIIKFAVNNWLTYRYIAGGVAEQIDYVTPAPTTFFSAGITWSASAPPTGEMRAYFNGIQVGATQVGLGVWAGAPAVGTTLIGAGNLVPGQVWNGYLAHGAVWDRPLTPVEMADLVVL